MKLFVKETLSDKHRQTDRSTDREWELVKRTDRQTKTETTNVRRNKKENYFGNWVTENRFRKDNNYWQNRNTKQNKIKRYMVISNVLDTWL